MGRWVTADTVGQGVTVPGTAQAGAMVGVTPAVVVTAAAVAVAAAGAATDGTTRTGEARFPQAGSLGW